MVGKQLSSSDHRNRRLTRTPTHSSCDSVAVLVSNTIFVSIIQVVPVSVLVDVPVCASLGPGVAVFRYANSFKFRLIFSSLDVDRAAGGGG